MADVALLFRQYAGKLSAFSRWEEEQALSDRPFPAVLADLGFVYSLLPPSDRYHSEDPWYDGVRKMREALSVLSSRADA